MLSSKWLGLAIILVLIVAVTAPPSSCRDKKRHCAYWARNGECTRNPRYMDKECKKSCNKCYTQGPGHKKDKGHKKKKKGKHDGDNNDEDDDDGDDNDGDNMICADRHRYCSYWKRQGTCRTNPAYMNDWCRKSCGKCNNVVMTTTAPVCKDTDRRCGMWRTQGYCRRPNGYMKKACKRTCGLCGGTTKNVVSKWSNWNKWSTCSTSCGQGVRKRVRTCPDKKCPGASTMSMKCNVRACAVRTTRRPIICKDNDRRCAGWKKQGYCRTAVSYMNRSCKRTCGMCGGTVNIVSQWSKWNKWTPCSSSCGQGGIRQRVRTCSDKKCPGDKLQSESCNVKPCVSKWNNWNKWTPCSASCGQGVQKRARTCPDKKCAGKSVESKNCAVKPCVRKSCGKQGKDILPPGIGRIVGGTNAVPGEWPWQVGILRRANTGVKMQNQLPFCGGTLISENIVLTAAHCFQSRMKVEDLFVRVGDHSMKSTGNEEKIISVVKLIKHKSFTVTTYEHDIAILVLKERAVLGKQVNSACLPDNNDTPSTCYVTGWGRVSQDGAQSQILQKVSLPIVSNNVCNVAYKKVFRDRTKIIGDNMICAGYKGGLMDACQGDSGGPMSCKRSDGTYFVKGIVSWGVGCAGEERYGVYTNTFKYIDWIEKSMQSV